MPIKKLRVSFDIDAEMFAKMLAVGHSEMNIQVFGTEDPRVSHTNPEPKLIADRGGMQRVLLNALKDKKSARTQELKVVIVDAGYSIKSFNGIIHKMQLEKLVRRAGYGLFAITKKGLANA